MAKRRKISLGDSFFKIKYEELVQTEERFVTKIQEWTQLPLKNLLGTFPKFEVWHQLHRNFTDADKLTNGKTN